MKVVTEFLPNREAKHHQDVEKWYQEAVSFMRENAGQWIMVDQDTEFHRSSLHKAKFDRFNAGSVTHYGNGWYHAEFRYPEGLGCVMYGMWVDSKSSKMKRWLFK